MTRIFCLLLSIVLILSMLGCRKPDSATEPENVPSESLDTTDKDKEQNHENEDLQIDQESQSVIMQQPLVAVSVPSITEETCSDDGTRLFQYTYQNMTLVLQDPDVAEKIIIDFLGRIDNTRTTAESTALAAKNAYTSSENWIPYLYHITYSPVRIDSGVLSLFGADVVYNGAFHPERTGISANYDLITGDVLTLASIMNYNASLNMICELVLSGLTEMHESNYLYSNYEETVNQRFSIDASQDESWYFTQTGLCFYFSPYEIAPYSSGIVTVEIPYDKLTGIIRDEYFPPERSNSEGTIQITPFEEANLSEFKEIAEIIENKEGNMYLLHTEKSVQDIRIIVSNATSSYTIFAAYGLSPGQAVVIQADANTLPDMILSYKSGGQTLSSNFHT